MTKHGILLAIVLGLAGCTAKTTPPSEDHPDETEKADDEAAPRPSVDTSKVEIKRLDVGRNPPPPPPDG